MSQFDIHANPFRRSREHQSSLVIVQSDFISQDFDSVVVAPLEPVGAIKLVDRLNPAVKFGNRSFLLITQELLTVRKSELGAPRGSLQHQRDDIIAALDMLFTGI
jgi:toxin CcdB